MKERREPRPLTPHDFQVEEADRRAYTGMLAVRSGHEEAAPRGLGSWRPVTIRHATAPHAVTQLLVLAARAWL